MPPCCLVFFGQDRQSWVPGPLLIPFGSGFLTQQAPGARTRKIALKGCALYSTVLCCDMERCAHMTVMLCCFLQLQTKRSLTAFSASSLKKADKSKPPHESLQLFGKQPRPTKMVTAWCCFSQCLVVTRLPGEREAWITC